MVAQRSLWVNVLRSKSQPVSSETCPSTGRKPEPAGPGSKTVVSDPMYAARLLDADMCVQDNLKLDSD